MNTEALADYHVHLGTTKPEYLLDEAQQNNVRVLGGLDRGHVEEDKLASMQHEAKRRGIIFLPSVECFASLRRNERLYGFELVGIDINLRVSRLNPFFHLNGHAQERHQEKVDHLTGWLENKGLQLDETSETTGPFGRVHREMAFETAIEVCKIASLHPANSEQIKFLGFDRLALSLPHHYRQQHDFPTLIAKAIYHSEFAFGRAGALPQPKAEDTIDNLHQVGAVVSVAHPNFRRSHLEGDVREILEELVSLGIDGIEAWHAGPADLSLIKFATDHNLVVTGGSDSDKQAHPGRLIGLGDVDKKDMTIPTSTWDDILEYKAKNGF